MFLLCCSSEVEVCWQLRAKEHHKVTLHNKPQTRDLFRKAQEKGWLSLLWWAAAENWTEGRLYIGFLGVGRGQEAIQDSLELEGLLAWTWALFSVMRPDHSPSSRGWEGHYRSCQSGLRVEASSWRSPGAGVTRGVCAGHRENNLFLTQLPESARITNVCVSGIII